MHTFKNLSVRFMGSLLALCMIAGNGCGKNHDGGQTGYSYSMTPGAGTGAGGLGQGPAVVNLASAGGFVILAKSAISTVPSSAVTGNVGLSPSAATFITGFSLVMDGGGTYSNSAQLTGQAFAADYTSPTPSNLTTAVLDMQAAYTDAAGRAPDYTELAAGNISGLTLPPATYKWGTGLLVASDVVLLGGANDVWIFQVAQNFTMNSSTRITLAGGALAQNVFWQTFGAVEIGTSAHFEGILLSQTSIVVKTGASVNGRLMAQTAVTLDANAVTQ